MADTVTVEPATNWGTTRRHYSLNLVADQYGGRQGKSLCTSGGIHTNVFDDVSINAQLASYRRGKSPIVVAELPECRLCARAKAKLEASRG